MGIYIIAEAGVNHNGEIDKALELVKVAKECGADAVKFQTFKSELNVSKHSMLAEYQAQAGVESEGQLEMLKKLELNEEEFIKIKKYCDELNIDFISTPDDEWSIDLLKSLTPPYIKIASAELNNLPFLKQIAATKIPAILSTGMGTIGEIEEAINIFDENLTILHCTSNYPTKAENCNMEAIRTLQNSFKIPVGFSDHTNGNTAAIIAVSYGVNIIEKHFTLDKDMEGPDHQASSDPQEFKCYVNAIREAEKMLGDGRKKPQKSEENMLVSMRRSIVAKRDLKKGEEIRENMLILKRPGSGIAPKYLELVIGKQLKNDILEDDLIDWKDLI